MCTWWQFYGVVVPSVLLVMYKVFCQQCKRLAFFRLRRLVVTVLVGTFLNCCIIAVRHEHEQVGHPF